MKGLANREGQIANWCCRNGVEVLTNTKVESINADELTLVKKIGDRTETQTVSYGACVWATGVAMHPLTKHLQDAMPMGTQTHSRYSSSVMLSSSDATELAVGCAQSLVVICQVAASLQLGKVRCSHQDLLSLQIHSDR